MITFIIPPSGFLLDDRMFPALGVLKVAAVLEQRGQTVRVLDLSGDPDPLETVRHALERRSTAVGLTATTPQLPGAIAIAQTIRRLAPGARVILGGPHATLINAAAKAERTPGRATAARARLLAQFDVVVAGDGEGAILEALAPGTTGLVDADDPAAAAFLRPADLDALPFPARHLVDLPSYRAQVDGVPATSVIGQLGCPFPCGFCGGRLSPTFRRIRLRSAARVVDELRHLYTRYGYRGFVFMDDEVNVSPSTIPTLDAIAALQDELGVRFALRGHIKAQLLTDAQAAALVRAGYRWIFVGFESGHPRILANIEKRATRDENTRCVEIARRHGLQVKALMSIGHPGESAETIRATEDWLLKVRPDDVGLSLITVYPGTPYYDRAAPAGAGTWVYTARSGDRLLARDPDFERDVCYFKGTPGQYTSFVATDALTPADLVAARDALEARWMTALGLVAPAPAQRQIEQSMGQCA